MPTYEYLCQTCSHRFETWQKMTDEPLTTCPACGAHIRRVLFPAGVVFKGSGFYSTDYSHAKSNGSHAHDEAKKPESSAETKGAGESKSTESKSSESTSGSTTSSSDSKAPTPANK